MACNWSHQAQLYHDGELPAAERAAFEAHLPECGQCRQMLAELAELSRALGAAPLPAMPDWLPEQLVDAWHGARRVQERSLRRLAGWMTAAAAAVLLGALMISPPGQSDRKLSSAGIGTDGGGALGTATGAGTATSPGAGGDWELVALIPPADQREDAAGSQDLVQVAQWMASDLSSGDRR